MEFGQNGESALGGRGMEWAGFETKIQIAGIIAAALLAALKSRCGQSERQQSTSKAWVVIGWIQDFWSTLFTASGCLLVIRIVTWTARWTEINATSDREQEHSVAVPTHTLPSVASIVLVALTCHTVTCFARVRQLLVHRATRATLGVLAEYLRATCVCTSSELVIFHMSKWMHGVGRGSKNGLAVQAIWSQYLPWTSSSAVQLIAAGLVGMLASRSGGTRLFSITGSWTSTDTQQGWWRWEPRWIYISGFCASMFLAANRADQLIGGDTGPESGAELWLSPDHTLLSIAASFTMVHLVLCVADGVSRSALTQVSTASQKQNGNISNVQGSDGQSLDVSLTAESNDGSVGCDKPARCDADVTGAKICQYEDAALERPRVKDDIQQNLPGSQVPTKVEEREDSETSTDTAEGIDCSKENTYISNALTVPQSSVDQREADAVQRVSGVHSDVPSYGGGNDADSEDGEEKSINGNNGGDETDGQDLGGVIADSPTTELVPDENQANKKESQSAVSFQPQASDQCSSSTISEQERNGSEHRLDRNSEGVNSLETPPPSTRRNMAWRSRAFFQRWTLQSPAAAAPARSLQTSAAIDNGSYRSGPLARIGRSMTTTSEFRDYRSESSPSSSQASPRSGDRVAGGSDDPPGHNRRRPGVTFKSTFGRGENNRSRGGSVTAMADHDNGRFTRGRGWMMCILASFLGVALSILLASMLVDDEDPSTTLVNRLWHAKQLCLEWGEALILLDFRFGWEMGAIVTTLMAAAHVRRSAETGLRRDGRHEGLERHTQGAMNTTDPVGIQADLQERDELRMLPGLVQGSILCCLRSFGGMLVSSLIFHSPSAVLSNELMWTAGVTSWLVIRSRLWDKEDGAPDMASPSLSSLRFVLSMPVIHHLLVIVTESFRAWMVWWAVSEAASSTEALGDIGQILIGTIAGCGGLFLPPERGLRPLQVKLPWAVQSTVFGAVMFSCCAKYIEDSSGARATVSTTLCLMALARVHFGQEVDLLWPMRYALRFLRLRRRSTITPPTSSPINTSSDIDQHAEHSTLATSAAEESGFGSGLHQPVLRLIAKWVSTQGREHRCKPERTELERCKGRTSETHGRDPYRTSWRKTRTAIVYAVTIMFTSAVCRWDAPPNVMEDPAQQKDISESSIGRDRAVLHHRSILYGLNDELGATYDGYSDSLGRQNPTAGKEEDIFASRDLRGKHSDRSERQLEKRLTSPDRGEMKSVLLEDELGLTIAAVQDYSSAVCDFSTASREWMEEFVRHGGGEQHDADNPQGASANRTPDGRIATANDKTDEDEGSTESLLSGECPFVPFSIHRTIAAGVEALKPKPLRRPAARGLLFSASSSALKAEADADENASSSPFWRKLGKSLNHRLTRTDGDDNFHGASAGADAGGDEHGPVDTLSASDQSGSTHRSQGEHDLPVKDVGRTPLAQTDIVSDLQETPDSPSAHVHTSTNVDRAGARCHGLSGAVASSDCTSADADKPRSETRDTKDETPAGKPIMKAGLTLLSRVKTHKVGDGDVSTSDGSARRSTSDSIPLSDQALGGTRRDQSEASSFPRASAVRDSGRWRSQNGKRTETIALRAQGRVTEEYVEEIDDTAVLSNHKERELPKLSSKATQIANDHKLAGAAAKPARHHEEPELWTGKVTRSGQSAEGTNCHPSDLPSQAWSDEDTASGDVQFASASSRGSDPLQDVPVAPFDVLSRDQAISATASEYLGQEQGLGHLSATGGNEGDILTPRVESQDDHQDVSPRRHGAMEGSIGDAVWIHTPASATRRSSASITEGVRDDQSAFPGTDYEPAADTEDAGGARRLENDVDARHVDSDRRRRWWERLIRRGRSIEVKTTADTRSDRDSSSPPGGAIRDSQEAEVMDTSRPREPKFGSFFVLAVQEGEAGLDVQSHVGTQNELQKYSTMPSTISGIRKKDSEGRRASASSQIAGGLSNARALRTPPSGQSHSIAKLVVGVTAVILYYVVWAAVTLVLG